MLAVDTIRSNLLAQVDSFIAQIQRNGAADTSSIKLEACLVDNSTISNTRTVIGTFAITDWTAASPQQEQTSLKRTRQGSKRYPQQLPSPLQDGTLTTPATDSNENEFRQDFEPGTPSTTTTFDNHIPTQHRRKATGGLRLGMNSAEITPPRTPSPPGVRQLEPDHRAFPKRRKIDEGPKLRPATVDKLIEGIWEQIHRPGVLEDAGTLEKFIEPIVAEHGVQDFATVSRRCRVLTGVSRTARSIEVIMQAHWIDCYEAKVETVKEQRPELRLIDQKRVVLAEACASFEWSEKDLRNRMAIWKGYREIRDKAGWAALVFSGPGIYRFCKYRMGFDDDAIDTIRPHWRQLLGIIGVPTQKVYHGHPHAWVVSKRRDPAPLAWTYRHLHPNFTFDHIDTCIVDVEVWGSYDPRRVANGPRFICLSCSKPQSDLAHDNECECFSDLFGPSARSMPAVQVYSTDDGRNNGLLACCTFERGNAIGEFVGVITKDLQDVDVMQSQGVSEAYQIYQGRKGNFTRFLNHSCNANCQFQTFTWLGIQRTVIVSKGVAAGKELTVDYSSRYWKRLNKKCLCGESACRYKRR